MLGVGGEVRWFDSQNNAGSWVTGLDSLSRGIMHASCAFGITLII